MPAWTHGGDVSFVSVWLSVCNLLDFYVPHGRQDSSDGSSFCKLEQRISC